MPAEVDEVRRRILQLEIEQQGLRRRSRTRAAAPGSRQVEKELASLNEEFDALKTHWETEKASIRQISEAREELEAP